jgi:hypothetical protein
MSVHYKVRRVRVNERRAPLGYGRNSGPPLLTDAADPAHLPHTVRPARRPAIANHH